MSDPTKDAPQPPLAGAAGSATDHRILLWYAINRYAEACGGKPGHGVYGNTTRMRCVSDIEMLVYGSPNAQRERPAGMEDQK